MVRWQRGPTSQGRSQDLAARQQIIGCFGHRNWEVTCKFRGGRLTSRGCRRVARGIAVSRIEGYEAHV